jgi:branched-chain amino acid aminotransferase
MCLFIIKDGVLITPDLGSDILESITRQTLFEICNDYNINCVERKITRSELYTADEAFFCGSGWEITPINQIDHVLIGHGKPGRITQNLQTIYQDIVCGRNTQYSQWLTPVY